MYYDGYQMDKDDDKRTPLMLWIEYCNKDIPKELYYDGYQTDKNDDGDTPLMMWIEYRDDDIP